MKCVYPVTLLTLIVARCVAGPDCSKRTMDCLDEARRLYASNEAIYAEAAAREALACARACPQSTTGELAEAPDVQGDALYDQAKYAAYEEISRMKLALLEEYAGSKSLRLAYECNELAACLFSQGRYVQALPLFQRSLEIKGLHIPPANDDCLVTLRNTAIAYRSIGEYRAALTLREQSIALEDLAGVHSGVRRGKTHRDCGMVFVELGEYERAEQHLAAAIRLLNEAGGAAAPLRPGALAALAHMYLERGLYDACTEGCVRLEYMLPALKQSAPGAHADACNTLGVLGNHHGRFSNALRYCSEALEWYRRVHGEAHPHVANIYNNIATACHGIGRFADAEENYLHAFEAQRRSGFLHTQNVARISNNLAKINMLQQGYGNAEQLLLAAHDLCVQAGLTASLFYASLLNNLAWLAEKYERHEHALAYYDESLKPIRSTLHPSHALVGTVMGNLAYLQNTLGGRAAAEQMLRDALVHRESTLGAAHYPAVETRHSYAVWLGKSGRRKEALRLLHENERTLTDVVDTSELQALRCRAELYRQYAAIDEPVRAAHYLNTAYAPATNVYHVPSVEVAEILYAQARLAHEGSNHTAAPALMDNALETLGQAARMAGNEDNAGGLRALQRGWCGLYCDMLADVQAADADMYKSYVPRVLARTERARARAMERHLAAAAARMTGGLSAPEMKRERAARAALAALLARVMELRGVPPSTRHAEELQSVESELWRAKHAREALRKEFTETYPRYRVLYATAAPDMARLQRQVLRPDEAVFCYWSSPRHVHGFVLTPAALRHTALPVMAGHVLRTVRGLYTVVTGKAAMAALVPAARAAYTVLQALLVDLAGTGVTTVCRLLGMSDIVQLDLDADAVALMACNTGAPAMDDAPAGTAELVRAFMYAGTARATGSPRPLSDGAAREFAGRLYSHVSRGAALTHALQASTRARRVIPALAHPFYWAGILQFGKGGRQ